MECSVSYRVTWGPIPEAETLILSKKSKSVGDDFHTFFGWAKKFLEIRSPENSLLPAPTDSELEKVVGFTGFAIIYVF